MEIDLDGEMDLYIKERDGMLNKSNIGKRMAVHNWADYKHNANIILQYREELKSITNEWRRSAILNLIQHLMTEQAHIRHIENMDK